MTLLMLLKILKLPKITNALKTEGDRATSILFLEPLSKSLFCK